MLAECPQALGLEEVASVPSSPMRMKKKGQLRQVLTVSVMERCLQWCSWWWEGLPRRVVAPLGLVTSTNHRPFPRSLHTDHPLVLAVACLTWTQIQHWSPGDFRSRSNDICVWFYSFVSKLRVRLNSTTFCLFPHWSAGSGTRVSLNLTGMHLDTPWFSYGTP